MLSIGAPDSFALRFDTLVFFLSLEMALGDSSEARLASDGVVFNATDGLLAGAFFVVFMGGLLVDGLPADSDSSVGLIRDDDDIRTPRFGPGSEDTAGGPLTDPFALAVLRIVLGLAPKEVTLPTGNLISLQYMITCRRCNAVGEYSIDK